METNVPESRPEFVQRIDRAVGEFFINPYALLACTARAEAPFFVHIVAHLDLACGSLAEVEFDLLAVAARQPGYYRELIPKVAGVECLFCKCVHSVGQTDLRMALKTIDSKEINLRRTADLARALADYNDYAREYARELDRRIG